MELIQADYELAAGSQAHSAGRRMEDVQSETGSITDPTSTLPTDGAPEAPPTQDNHFGGAFVLSASLDTAPPIYDIFSQNRGGAYR